MISKVLQSFMLCPVPFCEQSRSIQCLLILIVYFVLKVKLKYMTNYLIKYLICDQSLIAAWTQKKVFPSYPSFVEF